MREQYLVVCNIAKWTILCTVVHFRPVIKYNKITSKWCQSASQTCDVDAKNANFSGEGAQPPPHHPYPVGRGTQPPHPHPLDLNPSHSEILPTLLPLAVWKPHQGTRAWRHQLKTTRGTSTNHWATSVSWSSIWLKRGQQPTELHWSSDWSVARLF